MEIVFSLDACFYHRKGSREHSSLIPVSRRLRTWCSGAVILKVCSSPRISITWGLVRNIQSPVPPLTWRIRNSGLEACETCALTALPGNSDATEA